MNDPTHPLTVVRDTPDDTPDVHTFTVTPIVEGDGPDITLHAVQVGLTDIAWRQLVGDIARAVYDARIIAPIYPLMLAAGRPENDLDRMDALTKLVDRLDAAGARYAHPLPPVWNLQRDEAVVLAYDVDNAAREPEPCRCGNVIARPSSTGPSCATCAELGR